MSEAVLTWRRALEHRAFIAPEFGAPFHEGDPRPLSHADILADDKLAQLGKEVYAQLREQFAEPAAGTPEMRTVEGEAYRRKLESWTEVLEILLEETHAELDKIGAPRGKLRAGRRSGRSEGYDAF